MADQADVLSTEVPKTEVATPVQNDPYADLLKTIVAPDGRQKYTSVQDALVGTAHAQTHIQRLEAELAEARQKLQGAKTADEVLQALTAKTQPETPSSPAVDPADVSKLAEQAALKAIQEREALAQKAQNRGKVNEALLQKYGDPVKAREAVLAKAKEYGVDIAELAERSPAAALKFFDDVKPASTVTATSTVSTTAIGNQQQPAKIPNVMFGASTKDILGAWRAAGQ